MRLFENGQYISMDFYENRIPQNIRPQKITFVCVFPVTCLKILGSIGRKNLFFNV